MMKTVRPLPQSKMNLFGQWIAEQEFCEVLEEATTTDKVNKLTETLKEKIDELCPPKPVKVFARNKEFMNEHLHKFMRAKAREYRKNKKSRKYLDLQQKFAVMKRKNC